MNGPLAGVKVVEVANWVAVPSAGALMADMGAEVTKVEPLAGDSWRKFGFALAAVHDYEFDTSYAFQMDNRGKRSVALDLSKRPAQEIVTRLTGDADVFMSNIVPRRLERFNLTYEDLRAKNPRLIYLSFNGYGAKGPHKDRLGFDTTAWWARSGMMSRFRQGDQAPVILPSGFGDHVTSPMLLCGILAALWERQRTGEGQKITGSLLNSALWALGADLACTLVSRCSPRQGLRNESLVLINNVYQTKDGKWFMISADDKEENWAKLCKAIGRLDLLDDPANSTQDQRSQRIEELRNEVDKSIGALTLQELAPRLDEQGMVWEPMQDLAEVVEDRQVLANEMIKEIDHPNYGKLQMLDTPLKFSNSEVGARGPAPEVGEQTEEVLQDLGYTWNQIAALKDEGGIL